MYSILAIEMYVHVMWLPLAVILSALAGMLFRTAQLKKSKKRVLSLENDMLRCHADILKLEQKLAVAEKAAAAQPSSPVVPMNEPTTEELKDPAERNPRKSVNK